MIGFNYLGLAILAVSVVIGHAIETLVGQSNSEYASMSAAACSTTFLIGFASRWYNN